MKRISPISRKVEATLREVVAMYPVIALADIHRKLLSALASKAKPGTHDFRVMASLVNFSNSQLPVIVAIQKVVDEIDKTGLASPKSLDAIMDAAGYELEENGHAIRAKRGK